MDHVVEVTSDSAAPLEYQWWVRAMLAVKTKERANKHAARLFDGLAMENVGRYWKDNRLWEFRTSHLCRYADEPTAVWETLLFFQTVHPHWLIHGPDTDPSTDALLSGVADVQGDVLHWCSFELLRKQTNSPTC